MTTLARVLVSAAERCRCADEAVVPPLLAALPDVYAPLRGRLADVWNDVTLPFCRALDGLLVAYAQDIVPLGVPEERRTPACVASPSYADARRGVFVVAAANPLLHEWAVEASSVAATRLAAGHPMDVQPPACLSVLLAVGPRLLLDAVPDAVAANAWSAGVLAAAPTPLSPQAVTLQATFMESLHTLALVDPPRLRAVDGIAATLAAVEAPSCRTARSAAMRCNAATSSTRCSRC